VVWSRAEDGGRSPDLREAFDLAVARAVAAAPVICELCLPFVRAGGWMVAAKGASPEQEVAAARRAVGILAGPAAPVKVVKVDSFAPEGQRTALVVRKAAATPALYPRHAGTPARRPL
jgi:16S rRNA G527 N7-methylase RsmG